MNASHHREATAGQGRQRLEAFFQSLLPRAFNGEIQPMKTTNKSKTKRSNPPKPDSAPDPQTAVVVFKSGASLTLQFLSGGSPNNPALEKFRDAYVAWVTAVDNRKPGGCYNVASWDEPGVGTRVQSVVISWAEVQAINYSF